MDRGLPFWRGDATPGVVGEQELPEAPGSKEDRMEANALRSRWSWLDSWPGLARLWLQGSWVGFCVALLSALVLQVALVHRILWPEWFASPANYLLPLTTLALWILGCIDGRMLRVRLAAKASEDPHLDLFVAARTEYLRGRWVEAEKRLSDLLELSPEDAEARLLRATLLRHQGRLAESREQLRRLQRWNRSAIWNLEIRREWEYLSRAGAETVAKGRVPRSASGMGQAEQGRSRDASGPAVADGVGGDTTEVSGSPAGSVIDSGWRRVA